MMQGAENIYLRSLSLRLTERHKKSTVSLGYCFQLVQTRHRNRRISLGCTHEHLSMKMAVATTTHHSYTVLCDTGFNSSWSWRTHRCEVIRIGDRDCEGQTASSMPMRAPVSGDRALGYLVNSPRPMGNVRVKLTTGHRYLSTKNEKILELEDVLLVFHTSLRHCVVPSREARTPWPTQCVICTKAANT